MYIQSISTLIQVCISITVYSNISIKVTSRVNSYKSDTGQLIQEWDVEVGITERAIKIIPCSGAEGEWREWSAKFLARARLYGYIEALQGPFRVISEDKPTKDPDEMVARDLNTYAYSSLISSCEGVPFSIVNGAKTDAIAVLSCWIVTRDSSNRQPLHRS